MDSQSRKKLYKEYIYMVVRNLPHRLLIGNNTLPKLHNILAGWSKLTSPVGLGHARLQVSSSGSGAPFPINSGDIVVTRVMLSSGWTTGSQDIKGRHMMPQALMQNWLAYSFYHISLLKPVPRQGCSGRHLPRSRANEGAMHTGRSPSLLHTAHNFSEFWDHR